MDRCEWYAWLAEEHGIMAIEHLHEQYGPYYYARLAGHFGRLVLKAQWRHSQGLPPEADYGQPQD